MEERVLSDADLDEAKDLDQRFAEALRSNDLDAVMACFWDDPGLHVVVNGEVCRGSEAVRAVFKQMLNQHESVTLTVEDVSYVRTGEGVIGVGTAIFDMKPPGAPGALLVERWSDLRRKVGGRWVYVLEHATFLPSDGEGGDTAE